MLVVQVNSHEEDKYVTLDQLRLEARCALAYGVRSLSWGCYCRGWWYNNVLDAEGNKTEQYEKLREVNLELRSMASDYDRYTHESTHKLTAGDGTVTPLGTLTPTAPLLVGVFKDKDGTPALLLAPLSCGADGEGSCSYAYINKEDYDVLPHYTSLTVKTPSESYTAGGENLTLELKNEPILIFPARD
jgi:hypothetical protein